MSTASHLNRIRWRTVVPTAAGLLLLALALVAVQTQYSLLPPGGKHRFQITTLRAVWWIEQCFYWSTLIGMVVAAVLLGIRVSRRRSRTEPIRPAAWRGWAISALFTLAALQALGAIDLWLADRPIALPDDLPAPPPGQLRIAAIGGSSAAGFPYERQHAFPAMVGRCLQQLFPQRRVVVENLAQRGFTLEAAYRRLRELEARPHVLLVYAGHNEFLMRYRLDRDAEEGRMLQPSFLARALARRIAALGRPAETVDNLALASVRRPLFDRPVCNTAELARRQRNFRRHLEAAVRWCRRHSVLPLLIIPAANESGFEPCRSCLPLNFPADKAARLRDLYTSISSAATGDLPSLREARALCPTFAMTSFLLGRVYEQAGDYERAEEHYQQALADDGFPWHATPFSQIYREVAAAYDVPLLDANTILRPLCPNGILGDELFHDVLHPSLTAHLAISRAVVDELRRNDLPVSSNRWPTGRRAAAQLSRALEVDSSLWARVCDQVAKAQLGVPPARFDGERRRRKASRYSEAAAMLRSGVPVDALRLPGIGYGSQRP